MTDLESPAYYPLLMNVRCVLLAFVFLWHLSAGQELLNPTIIPLEGETYHVQGMEVDGNILWLTAVDSSARKGYLFEYSLPSGRRIRSIEIQQGSRFHPGGIAADGPSLWVPVAEYRPKSSAVIQRRDKRTMELQAEFSVSDHIGCIAVDGDTVVGGNWDSRELYVWNTRGELQRTLSNPRTVAYQDMKFADGRLVASGLTADRAGELDWLDFPSLVPYKQIAVGRTDRGQPYTREAMAIRGGRIYFLPEDSHSRLFIFTLK